MIKKVWPPVVHSLLGFCLGFAGSSFARGKIERGWIFAGLATLLLAIVVAHWVYRWRDHNRQLQRERNARLLEQMPRIANRIGGDR